MVPLVVLLVLWVAAGQLASEEGAVDAWPAIGMGSGGALRGSYLAAKEEDAWDVQPAIGVQAMDVEDLSATMRADVGASEGAPDDNDNVEDNVDDNNDHDDMLEELDALPLDVDAPDVAERAKLGSPVQRHGQLSVQGNVVVDQSGEPVQLRGMSLFWSQWMGQYWNKDVIGWLASDWGVSVVRAAMGVGSGGYLQNPDAEKAKVTAVVDAAIAAGIYVIIDWHEENADQHVEQSKAFFDEMAQMYGKQPNVIFEPFNEPTSQSWADVIKPYHEQIVPVIRKHSRNLIVLGTRTWSQDVDEAARKPVSGQNLAYTLHFYAATHKGELRAKAQTALSANAALFVTEWGTCEASGGGSLDLGEAHTWLSFLADNHISCANWAIDDKAESCAALKQGASGAGGWPASQLTQSGNFVRGTILSGAPGPVPGPSPAPAPRPSSTKHYDRRGGCSCECSWASSSTCHTDDGTCCFGCCCGSQQVVRFVHNKSVAAALFRPVNVDDLSAMMRADVGALDGAPDNNDNVEDNDDHDDKLEELDALPLDVDDPGVAESANSGSPVQRHGQLSVQGNVVVDQSGEPVQLRGMSLFWSQWMGQYWNKGVIGWLASDWGASVVRAAMGVGSGGYLQNPDAEKAKVTAVVDAAIAAGIYVIIDWHEENADQHVEQSKAFFDEMAQMYGKQPNVIFEPFNEPTSQSWADVIKPYHEQIVPVIRKHSQNLIVLGTRTWSQDVDEAALEPVSGRNLAYTLHFYAATHKGELRAKAQTALSANAALFVTEWGTCEASGGGSLDLGEAHTWLSFLADNHISCANWAIDDKAESCAALKQGASGAGGWPASQLTESGNFVRGTILGGAGSASGPVPAPSPASAPGPSSTKHYDRRGGCSCECSWASSSTCHTDDGTCCFGCCCPSEDDL